MSGFDFRVFRVWQILGFTQPFLASTSCLAMECFRICMLLGHFQELKERTAHDFICCVCFPFPWETRVPGSVLPLLLTLDCSPASSCSLQWQMLWLRKWQWELGPLPVILFLLKFDAWSHFIHLSAWLSVLKRCSQWFGIIWQWLIHPALKWYFPSSSF